MLSQIAHVLFYVTVTFLGLMCVLIGNAMDKQSSLRLRVSLNVLVIGTTGLAMAVYYGVGSELKLICATLLLGGISGWLLFGREHLDAELSRVSANVELSCRNFIESIW
jgi:hypothetical protein